MVLGSSHICSKKLRYRFRSIFIKKSRFRSQSR